MSIAARSWAAVVSAPGIGGYGSPRSRAFAGTTRVGKATLSAEAQRAKAEAGATVLFTTGIGGYGSPRPVRNCALGGDDIERLRVRVTRWRRPVSRGNAYQHF